MTTSQTLTGLSSGWWTFRANIKSGGPVNSSKLVLSGCGTDGYTVLPSTETDDMWLSLAVSANVTTGTCTLKLNTTGAGAWASMDGVTFSQGKIDRKVRGADLSGVPKNEANGAAYAWSDGTAVDSVIAFAGTGTNLVRLKVWVNPADGYNTKTQVVAMAQRAQAKGMRVLIDFHYSDRWTDPGAQGIPAAWQGLNPAGLADAVYTHTRDVMSALKAAGITPYGAQIGNEINPGMLWPYGQTTDVDPNDNVVGPQWDNLASFLKAGARAVAEVSPTTRKVLHLTNLDKGVSGLSWWFDEVTARAVPFDIIGLSYYGYWHGTLANLQGAVTTRSSRFNKDVIVVETSYPFTLADNPNAPWENDITSTTQLVKNYPATPAGQAANFRAVQDVVASAPGGRGLGAVYWEPAWTSVRATAGTRQTPPPATPGKTRQSSITTTGRCRPSMSSGPTQHQPSTFPDRCGRRSTYAMDKGRARAPPLSMARPRRAPFFHRWPAPPQGRSGCPSLQYRHPPRAGGRRVCARTGAGSHRGRVCRHQPAARPRRRLKVWSPTQPRSGFPPWRARSNAGSPGHGGTPAAPRTGHEELLRERVIWCLSPRTIPGSARAEPCLHPGASHRYFTDSEAFAVTGTVRSPGVAESLAAGGTGFFLKRFVMLEPPPVRFLLKMSKPTASRRTRPLMSCW